MEYSAFLDKSRMPREEEVRVVIGKTFVFWSELIAACTARFAPLEATWKFSGQKYGWSLQLKQKKRAVVYLTPCRGYFRASFAFGDKAVQAAHAGDLPPSLLDEMDQAKKYAEGRPVRVEVRKRQDAEIVQKLAEIKMAN